MSSSPGCAGGSLVFGPSPFSMLYTGYHKGSSKIGACKLASLSLAEPGGSPWLGAEPPFQGCEFQENEGAASLHTLLLNAALLCSGGLCQLFLFIQVTGTGMWKGL